MSGRTLAAAGAALISLLTAPGAVQAQAYLIRNDHLGVAPPLQNCDPRCGAYQVPREEERWRYDVVRTGDGYGPRLSFGLGLGTMGVEAQVGYVLSDSFSLRAGVNWLDADIDATFSGVDYDAGAAFTTGSLFLDWRPFQNWFTLTGGAYFGDRTLTLAARPTAPVRIGANVYTPAQVGTLLGEIRMDDVAPYLGVGADTTAFGDGMAAFRASVGVAYSQPSARLAAVGGTAPRPGPLDVDLAQEVERIEDDAEALRFYPVLSAGLNVRF